MIDYFLILGIEKLFIKFIDISNNLIDEIKIYK